MNRKSLITFLFIAFGGAWVLFCLPLAFKNTPETYTLTMQIFFALAMWAPGLGAIIATRVVEKQPVSKTLRLNILGARRYYLAAWFLPPLITFATIGASILLGTGSFDPNFTFIRESMTNLPAQTTLPPVEILVLAQTAFALVLAPFINLLFAMGEELGWRGFLLPKLMPFGQWRAILLSGLIFFFLQPGFDTALAGSPIGLAGWIPIGLMIIGLVALKQLPVSGYTTLNKDTSL